MIQGIIIAILFALAVFYIGRMAYKALFVKKDAGIIANAVLIFRISIKPHLPLNNQIGLI